MHTERDKAFSGEFARRIARRIEAENVERQLREGPKMASAHAAAEKAYIDEYARVAARQIAVKEVERHSPEFLNRFPFSTSFSPAGSSQMPRQSDLEAILRQRAAELEDEQKAGEEALSNTQTDWPKPTPFRFFITGIVVLLGIAVIVFASVCIALATMALTARVGSTLASGYIAAGVIGVPAFLWLVYFMTPYVSQYFKIPAECEIRIDDQNEDRTQGW